jgi:heptosyltransferase-2/heptosyltransferase-3
VADILSDQLECTVVFTGGGHELPMIRNIINQMKHSACVMAGNTEIGQLAALYARALVVIGPDSGPMHLAAAVKTPTVSLFGPADPLEFAPWGARDQHYIITSDIGCRPCRVLDWGNDAPEFHPCVRDITTGRVLDAARRAVQATNRG